MTDQPVAHRARPVGAAGSLVSEGSPPPTATSRGRTLAVGIVSSLAGKAVGLAAPLVVTPLTFGYLGPERYGLWMAVTSLTSMALFADFGLGNGLLTRLSRLRAEGDDRTAAREIGTAYALLACAALVLFAVLAGSVRLVDWPALFGVPAAGVAGDVRPVMLVCLGAFLLNLPLALVQRVQYAYQEVGRSNLWQAGGSLVSVALVFLAVRADLGPLPVIAAAVLAVPATNLVNTIHLFGRRYPRLRPRLDAVDLARAGGLLRLGVAFFAVSVLSSVALNLDAFLVGRVLGLAEAATYAVVLRLFALLALFVTLVNLPLWPANGEALARGDLDWVRRTTARMVCLSAAAVAVPATGLVFFGNDLLRLWLGDDGPARLPTGLFAALAVGSVLLACAAPLFMAQNSLGLLRPQLAGWSACLALSIPAKVYLANALGLTGVAVVASLAYAVTVLPAAVLGYRRVLIVVSAHPTDPLEVCRHA
ncbi:lipopolysaccharide biosynthesis protein [Micromonospora sp. NPDC048930]|uniref:lipopolysaccharide biosynthesis protein n=1 Tax=Micromonospora sp. NPDC048930 TaxID=3364261 RepID=UPI0037245ED5